MDKQEEDELERELADAEVNGDDGFDDDDDDMMDKMSSSPSIIDGGLLYCSCVRAARLLIV